MKIFQSKKQFLCRPFAVQEQEGERRERKANSVASVRYITPSVGLPRAL